MLSLRPRHHSRCLAIVFAIVMMTTAAWAKSKPQKTKAGAKTSAPKVTTAADGAAGVPSQRYQRAWVTAEDLRLGVFRAPPPPYPFPELGDDKAKEVFVDTAGQLYKQRKYSGVIPNWRSKRRLRRGRCRVQDQSLNWVGFQNAFNSSRIFVQVDNEACGYVYRPDPHHIVIDLPAVSVTNNNLLRDILTGAFPTSVSLIRVQAMEGKGVRVTIALREPRRYLSAHLGRFLFVDVAR